MVRRSPEEPSQSQYHVTLESLERAVRVPYEDLVQSQPTDHPSGPEPDFDEERNALRRAGGL